MTKQTKMTALEFTLNSPACFTGQWINTEAIGEYPGGPAKIIECMPDPDAGIVLQVEHPTFGEMGIFEGEEVEIVPCPEDTAPSINQTPKMKTVEPSSETYRKKTVLALESQGLREGVTLDSFQTRLLHSCMGLSTEAAELLDQVKKHLFYGKPLDTVNLLEEAGDIRWYLEQLYDVLNTTDEAIRAINSQKLALRYPGKFDQQAALHRNLDAERAVLEKGKV